MPADLIVVTYCTFIVDDAGIYHYLPSVPFILTMKVDAASGWHGHGAGTTDRPLPWNMFPAIGLTGADGCVHMPVKFPGHAGWYTLMFQSPGLLPRGVNNYTQYYDIDRQTGNEMLLTPYYYVEDVNKPYSFHTDTRHSDTGEGGSTARWVRAYLRDRIRSASVDYKLRSSSQANHPDLLDITRCSLPHGGIADNEYPNAAPSPGSIFNWVTRAGEEHATGAECDIVNPGPVSMANAVLAIQSVQQSYGQLGTHDPDGNKLTDIYNYWLGKDIWHVTWSSAIVRPGPVVH